MGLVRQVLVVAILAGCGPTRAPHPPSPSAEVLQFVTVMRHRQAGSAEVRIADGRRTARSEYSDRGNTETISTDLVLDGRGAPRAFRATGKDHFNEPIDEQLDDTGGTLRWRSTSEHGHAPGGTGWYVALNDAGDGAAVLARALLHAPGHRLTLLPAGEAWIEDETTKHVTIDGRARRLRRIAIAGLAFQPTLVWLDERDEMFAAVDPWQSVIRRGAEAVIPALLADDQAWTAARADRLARQLAHRPPAAGLAIVHARVFDSERRTLIPDQTVIVVGDRITAIGPAAPVPDGARVIDAHGKTLLPGLSDMHVHLNDGDGALYLASGVTTVRDLGNEMAALDARVARFDAGTELGPRVLRAGLIDGPGPLRVSIGSVADTSDEATAAVARYADAGYVQIKLYGSLRPALVPAIVAAAHARGLRVSGHVPFGMTAADAVEAGFDELQHVNFLFLRFLAGPTDDTRTALRVERVAERGADLDLAGKDVQRFLDLLVARKTVLDPTLSVFHKMFTSDAGELDPILVPFARRLPAQVERGARGGGLAAPGDKRARYRASYAAMQHLVKLAWDRQIPIVPGTDYIAGLSLSHELELYVQAGIPAADVLALATLGTARVMGRDHDAGSIAAGKAADLVLVDGDPTRDIAAVRNTDVVVCRGIVYDPAELLAAVGMRPR